MRSITTLLTILATTLSTSHALPNSPVPTDVIVTPGLPDWTKMPNLITFTKVEDLGLLGIDPPINVTATIEARDGPVIGSFQAFTGDNCNGAAGDSIQIGSASTYCIGTTNRHSFRVVGGPMVVSADSEKQCKCRDSTDPSPPPYCSYYNSVARASAGCYHVNTGKNWESSYVYYAP